MTPPASTVATTSRVTDVLSALAAAHAGSGNSSATSTDPTNATSTELSVATTTTATTTLAVPGDGLNLLSAATTMIANGSGSSRLFQPPLDSTTPPGDDEVGATTLIGSRRGTTNDSLMALPPPLPCSCSFPNCYAPPNLPPDRCTNGNCNGKVHRICRASYLGDDNEGGQLKCYTCTRGKSDSPPDDADAIATDVPPQNPSPPDEEQPTYKNDCWKEAHQGQR